jgi:hypothetical protein
MKRRYFAVLLTGAVMAVAPATASAHHFTCRASAVRVDVHNALTDIFAEPEVANQPGGNTRANYDPDPFCASDLREVASVVIPGSGTPILGATVLRAQTIFTPCGLPCKNASPARANAQVATAVINLGGHVISATVLEANAAASCNSTAHETLSGSSSILSLSIDGNSILDLNSPVTIPVDGLLNVYLNRQITGTAPDGDYFLTQRALEVTSPALGADVVVAEATADFFKTPCTLA